MVTKTKKKPATPALQRQKKYMAKRKAEGYARRCIMVPPQHLDEFNKTIKRLQKKWGKPV